jgi:D-alanyl-D-alanine carboxypeptidase
MTMAMISEEASGMILYVNYPGRGEFISAKGTSETTSGVPMNANYLFRIGSVSKTFVATVILQLVDEGSVKLDDTIDKYVNNTTEGIDVPNGDSITIKELLNHTSGLPEYCNNADLLTKLETDHGHAFTPKDLLTSAFANHVTSAPGTNFNYSNTNYILLGLVVEKANKEGDTVEAAVKRRIIDRLGLSNTSFPTTNTFPGPYIHGYSSAISGTLEDWSIQSPSFSWAAGCGISNISDLKIYLKALYDGTLLSPATQELKLTQWVDYGFAALPTLQYGLGWFRLGGFYGHGGSISGYENMEYYDPSTGATICFLLNNDSVGTNLYGTFIRIAKILIPGRAF